MRLRTAAKKALDTKGYTLGGDAPAFLVGFRATVKPETDFAKMFGHPETASEWARSLGVPPVPAKGTLIVRLQDPESLRPVWCGACQADIDLDVEEQEKRDRLSHIMELMLTDLPKAPPAPGS